MTTKNDIGPYYKIIGAMLLMGGIALPILKDVNGHPIDRWDVALSLGMVLGALLLVRPRWGDKLFKDFIARLPFTKFTGDK